MAIQTKSRAVLPTLAISFNFPDPPNALPPPHNHTPKFFQQHGVRGVLRMDVPATQSCDAVKITLQGQAIRKLGSSQSVNGVVTMAVADSQCREDIFLELTDVHHLEHAASFKKRLSYQTPFYFAIPNTSDPGHDLFKFNQFGLPPSLHVASSPHVSLHNGTWASVDISYQLKAYAFRDGVLVFTGSQPIQLVPCVSSIPPPTAVDDLRSEYAMTRLQSLKRMFNKKEGTLEVSLSEPKPLSLRADGQSQLHTISINCRLSTVTKDIPSLCATIAWRLKSSTTVSTIPLQGMPTVRQITKSPFLDEITNRSQTKSTDLRLVDWTACSDTPDGLQWKKLHRLWLDIPQPKDVVPSFFSTLASRRYSLELSIKVRGDGKAKFKFDIPVQFVWMEPVRGDVHTISALSLDSIEPDQQCPIYTR